MSTEDQAAAIVRHIRYTSDKHRVMKMVEFCPEQKIAKRQAAVDVPIEMITKLMDLKKRDI